MKTLGDGRTRSGRRRPLRREAGGAGGPFVLGWVLVSALVLAVACGSPTEPLVRTLGLLASTEDGFEFTRGSNPVAVLDGSGMMTIYAMTNGGCPVEYPDVEIMHHGAHVIVLLYEVRRMECREFWTADRVRITHTFEHAVPLDVEGDSIETVEVVARDRLGRLHRTDFVVAGGDDPPARQGRLPRVGWRRRVP